MSAKYNNPPVTVSAIITRDDKYLLCQRGGKDGAGKNELPGGFLEKGETLEQAVAREVQEELGVVINRPVYFRSLVGEYSDGRKLLAVYLLCTIIGEPKTSDEVASFRWTNEAPSNMFVECDSTALCDYLVNGVP